MHDFFARLEAAAYGAESMSRRMARQTGEANGARGRAAGRAEPHSFINTAPAATDDSCLLPSTRGRVVLIEGMDLAGKSTLVRDLQVELARRGILTRVSRNALCPDNPVAAVADQIRRDPAAGLLETGAQFLASHLWDARHFVPPPPGTIHLQDSCWLRTLAYHSVRGTPQIPELLYNAMRSFPRFDAAVFLTAGIAERRRRLAQRERDQPGSNDVNDHLVYSDPRRYLHQEQLLWQLTHIYVKATKIDTTGISGQRLVPRLMEILVQERAAMGDS